MARRDGSEWNHQTIIPDNEILFLPLGGAGEIGMNLSMYGCNGEWLVVDCGMTFGGDDQPGIDLIFPDIQFLEHHREHVRGIVITHAHEDHIGALPYVWNRLRLPIYVTPFAAVLLRAKNDEHHVDWNQFIHVVGDDKKITAGSFAIEMIPMTHSIPESHSLLITTPLGRIFHSGDWNFDESPPLGSPSSSTQLAAIGKQGVDLLVCDSTNVFVKQREGSERQVEENLAAVVRDITQGRVAVTFFASNIARMQSIARAAHAAGRHPVLVGRSMRRYEKAARQCGYLSDVPRFVSDEDAVTMSPDEVVYLCTGSQGEERAAMTRLAEDSHPVLFLEKGDTVLFSSRVIPGNERRIGTVHNNLVARGITVMDSDDLAIHISGHPSQEELAQLYEFLKPAALIPVHGEMRHLQEHVRFACEHHIERNLCVTNGTMARLKGDELSAVMTVPAGRLALYGNRILPLRHSLLHRRRAHALRGKATILMVMDDEGQLAAQPQLIADGIIDHKDTEDLQLTKEFIKRLLTYYQTMPLSDGDDSVLRRRLRRTSEEIFSDLFALRPLVEVRIVRVT